jgi:hypothetical protein
VQKGDASQAPANERLQYKDITILSVALERICDYKRFTVSGQLRVVLRDRSTLVVQCLSGFELAPRSNLPSCIGHNTSRASNFANNYISVLRTYPVVPQA